jgi:hypothetical protein
VTCQKKTRFSRDIGPSLASASLDPAHCLQNAADQLRGAH